MSERPLVERLLARAAEPVGLIDVREARARHARLADWVSERLALVEGLRARYGLAEESAWGEFAFAVTPGQTAAEGFDPRGEGAVRSYDLTAALGGSDATRANETEGAARVRESTSPARATPDSAPGETLRIGRRGAPVFTRLDRATDAREDVQTGGREHAVTPGRKLDAVETHGASEAEARPMTLTPPRASAPAAESDGARRVSRRGAHVTTANPTTPNETANMPAPKSVEVTPQSVEVTPVVGESPRAALPRESSTRSADLPLVTPARVPHGAGETRGTAPTGVAREDSAATTREAAEGKSPRGRKSPDADAGATTRDATPPVAEVKNSPRVRAKEITSDAAARESLTYSTRSPATPAVGRGNGASAHAASSSQQHNSAQAAARDFKTAAGGVEAEAYAAARGPKTRAAEINVGRLAEQVSRHLARRLLVERERRGMK